MGRKQDYFSIRKTIAAGQSSGKIPIRGKYFAVLDNSLVTNPKISVEGSSEYEIPAGIGIPTVEPFNWLEFFNPAAESMSLWIAVTQNRIDDARTIITASESYGQMPVKDISYAINSLIESDLPAPNISLPTWDDIHVLASSYNIDNAAAVDKGGGQVGIPVTGNPFNGKYGSAFSCRIIGSVNYDGVYAIAGGSVNEVVINATYVAETFTGYEEIGLHPPKHVASNTARKELVVYNPSDTNKVYWGDADLGVPPLAGVAKPTGIAIAPESAYIITCTDEIYFVADSAFGTTGAFIQINELEAV